MRPPGSACVWAATALLLLALLAGGGCLVLYVALPPAEAPRWLPTVGLALVTFPWAFWIATCAYRCCCSRPPPPPPPGKVERKPSTRLPATLAPLPSSPNLKSALSARSRHARRSPSPTCGAERRVHFGDNTVLGEDAAAAAEDKHDDASSVHPHETEEPLAALSKRSS